MTIWCILNDVYVLRELKVCWCINHLLAYACLILFVRMHMAHMLECQLLIKYTKVLNMCEVNLCLCIRGLMLAYKSSHHYVCVIYPHITCTCNQIFLLFISSILRLKDALVVANISLQTVSFDFARWLLKVQQVVLQCQDMWGYTEEDRDFMMESFGSVGDSMPLGIFFCAMAFMLQGLLGPRLSLYLSVTGGNDWSVYYIVMTHIGSFYPGVFLSYTFFFIFASQLQFWNRGQAAHRVAPCHLRHSSIFLRVCL